MYRNILLTFFISSIFTIKLFSYSVYVTKIDNDFLNLKQTKIVKYIYLTSEVLFVFEGDKIKKLFRLIESPENITVNSTEKEKNKNNSNSEDKKSEKQMLKVCIAEIEIIEVIDGTIKAKYLSTCKDSPFLDSFRTVKIGDFIEIETILEQKMEDNSKFESIADELLYDFISVAFSSYFIPFTDETENKESFESKDILDKDSNKGYKPLPKKQNKKRGTKKGSDNFEKIKL